MFFLRLSTLSFYLCSWNTTRSSFKRTMVCNISILGTSENKNIYLKNWLILFSLSNRCYATNAAEWRQVIRNVSIIMSLLFCFFFLFHIVQISLIIYHIVLPSFFFLQYAQSLAVMSVIGYVIGLGQLIEISSHFKVSFSPTFELKTIHFFRWLFSS